MNKLEWVTASILWATFVVIPVAAILGDKADFDHVWLAFVAAWFGTVAATRSE